MTKPKNLRYLPLGLLLLLYFALGLSYSYVIPFSKGPDEYINYQYIYFIAKHHRLPRTIAEKQAAGVKADWQPLYHLVGGVAASAVSLDPPPELKVTWQPPTRHLIDLILPRATLVRTEDERPPYRGEYAVWQIGRWLSLGLGAGTLVVAYMLGLSLWLGRFALATGLTALLVFIPRFLFTHAVLSDDTLLGFCLALYFLFVVRLVQRETHPSASKNTGEGQAWLLSGMGLTAGLAIVTKYTAVPAAAGGLLTIGWLAYSQKWPWPRLGGAAAWFVTGLTLATGWWLAWVWWHFNEVQRLGPLLGLLKPLLPGATVDDNPTTTRLTALLSGQSVANLGEAPGAGGNFLDWAYNTFVTFWGITVFGAEPVWPYPYSFILSGIALVFGVALVGLWQVYRQVSPLLHNPNPQTWPNRAVWLGLALNILLFFPLPLLRFALSGRLNDAAQGRHLLFPAGPAIIALLLAGGLVWVRPRWRDGAALLAGGLMLVWGVGHLLYLWSAYPPPLPVRTTPGPQLELENPLRVNFADILQLRGYQTRQINDNSVLQVDLLWQSLAQAWEDYQTELTLTNEQGHPRLRWLSHPAEGRFPVRAWQPGDGVRDTLYLPLSGLPVGEYMLQLRLLGWEKPLVSPQGETITLTTITLAENLPPASLALWQRGQALTSAPVYRYRETIPVTAPATSSIVSLVGPDEQPRGPLTESGALSLFIVDYDWPSGYYQVYLDGAASDLGLWVENFDTRRNNGWTFTPPQMTHPVQANFANQIELLGYDLPLRQVEAGEGIPLVLYWRGLAHMRQDYTIAVQLLDADLQRRGGYDRFPRETYHTYLWVPGEVVADGFAVPVAPDAPQGVYTIRVGWYAQTEGQVTPLPLVQEGQPLEETSVVIGPLKVGGPPPGVVAQTIHPENSTTVKFGEVIALSGYDLAQGEATLRLTLYWQSLQQTEINYTSFVHIRNQAGEIVAQLDQPPTAGVYPTSLWSPGETIPDEVIIPLPTSLPPGEYTVAVGLYDLHSGQRLPIAGSVDNSLQLSTLVLK